MASTPGRNSMKRSADGLRRLADAYDLSVPTLHAVADAIIARTQLTDGEYQRGAVMDLVEFIVNDKQILATLEKGGALPDDVLNQMAELIASDPPANVPEWELVHTVLDDVRTVLQLRSGGG